MTGHTQTCLRVVIGPRTVWLHGIDRRQAVTLFRRAGVPRWMQDPTNGAWCAPLAYADDILALADHGLRWRTVVEAVDA